LALIRATKSARIPYRRTLAARSDNAKEENEFCAIPLL
jgi:hypothetical protein